VSVETGGSSAAQSATQEVISPPLASAPAAAAGLPPDAGAPAELIQLLTPEGERVEHPGYPLDISAGELRGLYRDLVLVRRMDTEAIALQRQGELGLWASLLGQEAAQIGSGRALRPRDMAFPTYREHGVAWCRGVDPLKLLELFRGVSHGGWDPAEHNFHRTRSSSATRRCTRPVTRWASSGMGPPATTAKPSSPTSATAPSARAT